MIRKNVLELTFNVLRTNNAFFKTGSALFARLTTLLGPSKRYEIVAEEMLVTLVKYF